MYVSLRDNLKLTHSDRGTFEFNPLVISEKRKLCGSF